ncbi:MAG: HPF/RaiA family ribosome-associated protein [Deltaproteobacteria bacterium]|nr:HPF/RaiA family ribosome-associated protein [Deltaproteobacteria bacterium]
MQLDIEGRNTEIQERWRDLIERKLAKLEHYPNEITHARVTITHNPHHHVGDNRVQVILSVSGQTLTVKKSGAQIPLALRAALSAAEREVATYHESRKRFVKEPGPRPMGTIARVFRTKGYGFIQAGGDRQIYFHRNALDGLSFDEISKGLHVAFELEEGGKGPQAARVFLAGRR